MKVLFLWILWLITPMHEVIKYHPCLKQSNISIISDTLSALQNVTSSEDNDLYFRNIKNMICFHGKLELCWPEAHVGNPDNERINKLPKASTSMKRAVVEYHFTD